MGPEKNYWKRRAQSGRLSRRRFVGGAALAGLGTASLGLVGCGDDNDSSSGNTPGTSGTAGTAQAAGTAVGSATASETPKPGGTYTDGATGPFAGVDPHNSVYGGASVIPAVYNYLVRGYPAIHPERELVQDLAESQKLEDDNLTLVFKLRPGVKIAANDKGIEERDIDSSDVLASWNRIADSNSGANGFAFTDRWVDKMDAPDPYTFRMIMKTPYAWTLANVGSNLIGAIVPKEWLENADLKKTAVGGGPFTLTELVENSHATMKKNPTYYRGADGIPYVDQFIIRRFADQSTYRTAFSTKQIDIYDATDQEEASSLASADKSIYHDKAPSIGFDSFWMRVDTPPWNDDRVRQAVNLAINRDQFIQIIGKGQGEPIGCLTYAFKDYALTGDELKQAQPYDVAEAKKLFQAAGVSEFSFSHPTSSNAGDYVNILVKNMQDAGVKANAQALDAGTWVASYYANKLTASMSLNQLYTDPDFALRWYTTGGVMGNGHYATGHYLPEIDKAAQDAAMTLDDDERVTKYKDLQKLIMSKSPAFINFFGLYRNTMMYDYIHNYPKGMGGLRYPFLETVWTSKA